MIISNKRCWNGMQVDVDKKARSSYGHLKQKFAACKDEKQRLEGLVQELQMELEETRKTKRELGSLVEGTFCAAGDVEGFDAGNVETSAGSSYQSMKKNHVRTLANNIHLKNVVIKQGKELQELKKQNEQLEQGSVACCKVMRELSENITTLSNANDVQRIDLGNFRLKEREQHSARVWKQAEERDTKRAVCRAFGWKLATASATLLRAACGFWNATAECMECGDSRASFKRRMDLWINLTCVGFNGRVLVDLEKLFFERKKFNVVEICRKSDVDSQF